MLSSPQDKGYFEVTIRKAGAFAIGVAAKDCPLEGLLTPDKAATAWTVTSTQPGLPPLQARPKHLPVAPTSLPLTLHKHQVAAAWRLRHRSVVGTPQEGDVIGCAIDQADYPVQVYFYKGSSLVHQMSGAPVPRHTSPHPRKTRRLHTGAAVSRHPWRGLPRGERG